MRSQVSLWVKAGDKEELDKGLEARGERREEVKEQQQHREECRRETGFATEFPLQTTSREPSVDARSPGHQECVVASTAGKWSLWSRGVGLQGPSDPLLPSCLALSRRRDDRHERWKSPALLFVESLA